MLSLVHLLPEATPAPQRPGHLSSCGVHYSPHTKAYPALFLAKQKQPDGWPSPSKAALHSSGTKTDLLCHSCQEGDFVVSLYLALLTGFNDHIISTNELN